MRMYIRSLFAVVLSTLAWGCAAAPGSHAHSAAHAAPGSPEETVRRCALPNWAARQKCYEERLLEELRSAGVPAAMELLDRFAALDPGVKREGHVYAHAIGITAYGSAAQVGETFARCTPAYQSGCYHGVIQAYFLDMQRAGTGVTAEAANALCRDYRGPTGSSWLLLHCAHGMGHGLTMLHGHDLPRALRGCDLLASPFERESCYGGPSWRTS
jgi:hypothetical protein